MDFEKFLGLKEEVDEEPLVNQEEEVEKIGPMQFYGIITSDKPDWQAVIYDLIHAEQLDPWDIDIIVLTNKYFQKLHELEEGLEGADDSEETDFYVSSKVLLAASLLLRIKSEFLLNKSIKSIDEILFGRKEDEKRIVERIIVDEDELPILIPKTPLPRARRITLPELMLALNKAINTESRRIEREVSIKRAKKISEINLPEFRRIDLKDRIRQFYARVSTSIKKKAIKPDKELNKVSYANLIGKEREEKVACFLPLLHLSNNKKLWLEQEEHLEDIWVYLYKYFEKNSEDFLKGLDEDLNQDTGEEFSENVEGEKLTGLEKAKLKREEKKKLADDIAKELENELGIEMDNIDKEEKIEEVSGFADTEI